ncbi:MAG: hypothetical protein Q4F13_02585 [Pseudomonadota bacterium]|nr:hypothetical protein [Pseudomonadota bacterium]
MNRELLTELMHDLVESGVIDEERPDALGGLLFEVLLRYWDDIDEEAASILLCIAGMLKKQPDVLAEAKAAKLLAKLQGKVPKMKINGRDTFVVDHEFTFHVSHDEAVGKWLGVCDLIALTIVADDFASLEKQALEQACKKAMQNGVMKKGDTAVVSFKML